MNAVTIAVIVVAVFLASCMQASIGFGMGMLAAPVVALVAPALLPGLLIASATVVTLMVVVRERASLDLRGTGWALAGRVPGTVAGALLLVWLPARGLSLLLAAVVLGGVAVAATGWRPAPLRRNLATAGAASGLLGTATSIGGPPMALVYSGAANAHVRSNMSAFFLVGSLMSLGALAVTGSLSGDILQAFVALVPAVMLGFVASRFINRFLDRNRLRAVSIIVSALGATALIGQQIFF